MGKLGFSASVSINVKVLTLHQIAFDDHGSLRSICYRASISENARALLGSFSRLALARVSFDSGEYGLGYVSSEANAGKEFARGRHHSRRPSCERVIGGNQYSRIAFFL